MVLGLLFIVGCSTTQKQLVEGKVQRVGNDFVIIDNLSYDLCDNEEKNIERGDYLTLLYDGGSSGIGCNSDLLGIKVKDCNCDESKARTTQHKGC